MKKSEHDHNFYFLIESEKVIIVIIYVDDLLITGNNTIRIDCLTQQLEIVFEMYMLGNLSQYLGDDFKHPKEGNFYEPGSVHYGHARNF